MVILQRASVLFINIVSCNGTTFDVGPTSPALLTREVELATLVDVRSARVLNVVEEEGSEMSEQSLLL